MERDFRLTTARLALRPVVPADRADLIALEADPEVMRFLNGGLPVPEEGVSHGLFLTPRGTEPEVMAAHERETGRFVGWFALFDEGEVAGVRTAEFGYRLHREAWGKGYATEGVRALVTEAFERMGFTCVRAETMAVNVRSRRVMEKAGMRLVEARFTDWPDRVPGYEQGDVIYEVRRTVA